MSTCLAAPGLAGRWPMQASFKRALHNVAVVATAELLDALSDMAVREEQRAYKVIAALIVRLLREVKPHHRLKVFYALSAVARRSAAAATAGGGSASSGGGASASGGGGRGRAAAQLGARLAEVGALMADAPPEHRGKATAVLRLWRAEGVFPAPALARLRARLAGEPDPAPAADERGLADGDAASVTGGGGVCGGGGGGGGSSAASAPPPRGGGWAQRAPPLPAEPPPPLPAERAHPLGECWVV